MKIEIWSDLVCPFCYIGKKKFENAIRMFPQKNELEIEWKSFQLWPDFKTDPTKNHYEILSQQKHIPIAQAKSMSEYVTTIGKEIGITIDFDQSILANTYRAHTLLHYSKKFNKQSELKELLFRAYFTEGKNIDDISTLQKIAGVLQMDRMEVESTIINAMHDLDIQQDLYHAYQLGIQGVPFFVFDNKYVISGAQESRTFLNMLHKSFEMFVNEEGK